MACKLISGLPLGCRESVAGVKTVYLTNFENVTGTTVSAGDVVTNISMSGGTGGTKFYTFDLRRETADYTDTITPSIQNGTLFYEGVLNLFLEKSQTSVRNQIMLLAKARLAAIVLDKNGQYWLCGSENGLELTAGSSALGKAAGDANGYTLTFTAQESYPAREVSASTLTSITSY